MNKRNFIIQHPCPFTRTGLEILLKRIIPEEQLGVVALADSLHTCHHELFRLERVDMVIIGLLSSDYTPGDVLSLISDRLQVYRPDCKVVVIAETDSINILGRYLNGLRNVWAVIDPTVSLEALSGQLSEVINSEQNYREQLPQLLSSPLSARELSVLRSLLQGHSVSYIADQLRLSYKTVSHYKRSAQTKLGIRTLHPLLMNGYSKVLMNQVLCSLTKERLFAAGAPF